MSTIPLEVLVTRSCLTLCDPMDCSLPGSSVHGILQARILEWVSISFSRGSSQLRDRTQVSHIAGGFFNIWTTREAQEYWKPIPSPGIFLIQESNQGLLHCRRILYQRSYKENPMNIQDWFPLGLTGLISLLSKGLSPLHNFLSTFSILVVRVWVYLSK